MARTFTYGALETAAKQRSEMENAGFVNDAEWLDYAQDAYSELYDLCLEAWGSDLFRKLGTATTVAGGTDPLEMPSDFYRVLGVDVEIAGEWRMLSPLRWEERLDWNYETGEPKYYRLLAQPSDTGGATLDAAQLWPTADDAYDVRVHYVPLAPTLADDSVNHHCFNGWDEYIVTGMVLRALEKEESDTAACEKRLARLAQRIQRAVPARVTDKAPKVIDRRRQRDRYDLRRGRY